MNAAATRTETPDAYPQELRSRKQWLLWRYVKKAGKDKPAKMPYYTNGEMRTGQQGSEADRDKLATFDQASAACTAGKYDGIGFAFLPGDNLIGIDIDGAFDGDQQRQARAEGIIAACASYTEWSPSGKGVHIIVEGTTTTNKSNDIGLEVFCGRQFFTMSGKHYGGTPNTVAPIASDILARLHQVINDAKGASRKASVPTTYPHHNDLPHSEKLAKVEAALEHVDPNCGYDEWIRYGMAIKAELGDGGFAVWDAWSARSDKYQGGKETTSHWRSFVGNGVTGGTLYRAALDAGWRPPRALPAANDNRRTAPTIDQETGEIVDTLPAPAQQTVIDYATPLIDTNGKGRPLATIENLREICRRLNVVIRYNVISKDEEILIPGECNSLDNRSNATLAWLTSWCARFGMTTGNLDAFVTYLADQNLYNPVAEWVQSTKWDGQSRLQAIYDTIKAEGEDSNPRARELKETLIRRWLVSAIAAAFEPEGVSAHGVLVLQGAQYLGKTQWFKSLVPAHLGVVQDGMMLRPDDRDSVKQVCSFWLVELGELDATFRKSDIAALKSFITRKNDVLRRAYARKESQYARRTVFFGSVNPKQFLHDSTGNRRYWTIECAAIDHSHSVNMQQLWAEVLTLYRKGEPYYLSHDEMALLNDHNENFTVADPVEERLASKLDWNAPSASWQWLTATEVLIMAGVERPNANDTIKASHTIRKLNGNQAKRSNGKNLLYAPPKIPAW